MALNTDFRVKDSLHVGNSACFVGQTNAPTILSAGSSLFDIFLQEGEVSASCTLSGGLGVTSGGTFDGTTDRVFSVNTGVVNSVILGDEQGRICTTNLGGTTSQICITNLGATGTPTFGGTTVTGISATAANNGILSAGRDLADIFVTSACAGSVCSVTAEAGKPTITIGGSPANPTVRITDTCVTAISSAFCTITTDGSQGNIGLTRLNGGTSTLDIGLCCGDIVTFGGLNAGTSGISTTGLSATAANSGILSAGKDLNEIFQTIGSDSRGKVLSQGIGIQDFTYEGLSAQSIAVSKSILSGGFSHAQGILTLSGAGGVGYNTDISLGLCSSSSPTFNSLTTTANLDICGNIIVDGTVDGVDIEARDAILTSTQATAGAALPLSGGAMTGNITTNSCFDGVCVSQLATCPGLNATGTVCGTGTANFIPLWSNGTTQGNSTLSIHDSAVTSSNAISAVGGFAGDGSNLTGVTATACFPGTIKTTLVGGDKFFLNDGANKHTTYTTVLTSFASGCGLTTSGTGLAVNGAAALATNNLPRWNGSGFVDSIVKQTAAGNVNIAGGTTISGNLSVTGDFTCIETLLQTTSAVCIVNAGTGPALYAEQTGVSQPIAKFVDTEGTNDSGTVIIDDSGKVGIGTASPSEKLTFVGNLSGIGNSTITGTSNVTGLATFAGGITACIGSIVNNNVVVSNGGILGTDGIHCKVWACKLVDYGSSACNRIPKFTTTGGTLNDSNICDTGSLITLGSNVTLGNGYSLKLPAAGGTFFTEEKTFTATVGTSETGVPTFAKSGLKQVKYLISLTKGVNITAFEVNAVYNGTAPCGTTYGIVDAQAASQLADIKITSAGSTIDLDITALAATTTAVIHGVAVY